MNNQFGELEKSEFIEEEIRMLWSILGGVIIGILGVFVFCNPELIWKLTEEWKSYCADGPSDFYLKSTKVGGLLFVFCGIIMIVFPLILE